MNEHILYTLHGNLASQRHPKALVIAELLLAASTSKTPNHHHSQAPMRPRKAQAIYFASGVFTIAFTSPSAPWSQSVRSCNIEGSGVMNLADGNSAIMTGDAVNVVILRRS